MSEVTPIRIPRENIADDTVIIVKWLKNNGDYIKLNEDLLEIETSKAIITIEADKEGYLEILRPAGEIIEVGEKIAIIHPMPFNTKAQNEHSAYDGTHMNERSPQPEQPLRGLLFSRKALLLMEQNGIDHAVFEGRFFIREKDVHDYLATRNQAQTVPHDVFVPTSPSQYQVKSFFSEIFHASKNRNKNLFLFFLNYIFRNYLLNLLTPLAPVGLIIFMHKLRGVKIGKGCFIDPSAQLETAYPENIIIGDDVRITAHCVVMTHIKASNYLQDTGLVPVMNRPVIFEDHCFIGVNSVIMPGVRIGRASVVNSGSVVISNVPPYCIVAGNPAKVVKRFPQPTTQ
jgi:acetyltransferase-like isoleucine patch superfamily enzyme